jgi:hypothetical protein
MEGEQEVQGKRAGAHGISSIVADPPGGGPADVKPSSSFSFFASGGGGGEPLSRFIQPVAGRQIRVCAAEERRDGPLSFCFEIRSRSLSIAFRRAISALMLGASAARA